MYLGIDLAGSEKNPTGICLLNHEVRTFTVHTDEEILELFEGVDAAAVDAPLTDTQEPFREAERELMREYGPMLPLNTPGMKMLSDRALKLFDKVEVVETYPRAVEKVLDTSMGDEFENKHEYDAYLCAITAKSYSDGEYRSYGCEEKIVLPEG